MLLILFVLPPDCQEVFPFVRKKEPWTYRKREAESAPGFLAVLQVVHLVVGNSERSPFVLEDEMLIVFSGGFPLCAFLNLILSASDIRSLVAAQSGNCDEVKRE